MSKSPLSGYVQKARSGDLFLDPHAAIDAHKATRAWIDALSSMASSAANCGRPDGFPAIPSAQTVADKFGEKATGPQGLRTRIEQHLAVANDLADLLRYSIKKFESTDEQAAGYLQSL